MAQTMTASGMTDGQIDNAVDKLRAAMRKHRSEIPSDIAQQVLGVENLGMEMFAPFRKRAEAMLVLVPRSTVAVTLEERHEPDSYYKTPEGLYVWGDFRDRVVAKAKPVEAGTIFKVNVADLCCDATDEEIEAALPQSHLFDETAVCGVISGLIARQTGGESGDLENTGLANLFYTGSWVVDVYWSAGRRLWDVRTWRRGGGWWGAGNLVLSPAN